MNASMLNLMVAVLTVANPLMSNEREWPHMA